MRSKVLKPIGIFLIILALIAGILIFIVQTGFFREFVKVTTNSFITALTNQKFSIGSIEGNFLKGITLKNLSFKIDNENFIDCDEVYIDYSLPIILDGSMVFSKVIPFHEVSVKGLRINLVRSEDGVWNFEKLVKPVEGGKRENPDWNIIIRNSKITDAKMVLDDRYKGELNKLEMPYADLSLRMFKIADKAELNLKSALLIAAFQSMDYEKLYFKNISGKAEYSNKEKIDRLDVKRLVFNFWDADIVSKGEIRNLMDPSFQLSGTVRDINLQDLGSANVEVEARGTSPLWEDLQATGELRLVNSELMNKDLRGRVGTVTVDNINVKLENGELTSDYLGNASFDGRIVLHEIRDESKNNTYDFGVTLESIKAPSVFGMLEKHSGSKNEFLNQDIDALVDSDIHVTGGWREAVNVETNLDISGMTISGGEMGEINLSGPVHVTEEKTDYDLDTVFSHANFTPILGDERFATDFNSKLRLKGSLDTGGEHPQIIRSEVAGELLQSKIMDTELKGGRVDLAYTPDSISIRNLIIDSNPMKVKASGSIGQSGARGIDYDISIRDLRALSRFSPDLETAGAVDMTGTIKGSMTNPRISVAASGSDFLYEKQKFKAKKIEISGESSVDVRNLGLDARGEIKGIEIGDRTVQIAGFSARSNGTGIAGTLDIQETSETKYSADFRIAELGGEETRVELPSLTVNLEDAVLKNRRPIQITILKDGVNINSFNLYHKENYVIGDVSLGFDESMDGTIKLEKLSLPDASELLNVRFPVKGEVSGEVKLGNSVRKPNLEARIVATDLEYMKFKSDELNLSLLFSDNKLGLNMKITDDSEVILSATAEADIPLDMENVDESIKKTTYSARITSNGVDISPLIAFNEEIQSIEGKLLMDITAAGTGEAPKVSGRLELRDMSLKVLALNNKITIKEAVMDMDGKYGTLRPVTIKTGEGEGIFEGRIDFRDLSYNGKGTMDGMLMNAYPSDVTANLDGNVVVEGKFLNAFIKGDITAKNIKAIVPEKPLKEIESIRFVDDESKQEEFIYKGRRNDDYVEEYIALDLNVDIPKDSWVKGSGANIEVEGRLAIDKNYGDPYVVSGNIDVVRGDYQFMGKLFKVDSGTVSFRGKKIIDPFLDLRATYEVSSVDVYINIHGTAQKPRIQLSSDPPLDENEIVSYLVFGTSSDNLSSDERIEFQEKAGEVLGTVAVGELRELIGEEFAIDVMTIKGGQTGFRDTHFEIGKYLTEDLYVGYERLSYERFFYERYFFSPGVPYSTVTADRAVIEYRVTDFMTLESEIGDETGADVFFNFDY